MFIWTLLDLCFVCFVGISFGPCILAFMQLCYFLFGSLVFGLIEFNKIIDFGNWAHRSIGEPN